MLKIPTGIAIGDTRVLRGDDWEAIARMGFSYVNMYAHQLPMFVWDDPRITKMVSIGPGYILEQVKALSELDSVAAVVAALTPHQGVGQPFTMLDGTTLKLITNLSSKPVFVPTQRTIRPQDLHSMRKLGCRGLLLTTTVYGETPQSCRDKISSYRAESVTSQMPSA